MYDNYNYPPGADTPDAPWNQPADPDPIDVVCDTCVTLRKSITVTTTNYEADRDETGCDITLNDGYQELEQHVKEQHTSLTAMLDTSKESSQEASQGRGNGICSRCWKTARAGRRTTSR